jgi:hypothetical protein
MSLILAKSAPDARFRDLEIAKSQKDMPHGFSFPVPEQGQKWE